MLASAGLFDVPELSAPDGFDTATQRALSQSKTIVDDIIERASSPDIAVIQSMDRLSNTLCNVADLAECVRQVHPDPVVVQKATNSCIALGGYVEELNTNPHLYNALKNLMSSEQYRDYDEVTKSTAETFLHDFEISGIHLESTKREKVVSLNRQILELSYTFHLHTSEPVLVPKESCPPVLTGHFHTRDGHVQIDHVPMTNVNSDLRGLSYMLFYGPQKEQEAMLRNLVHARHELATLVGYPTFAHRVLKTSMARDPDTVIQFLSELSEKVLPLARAEVSEMLKLKRLIKPEQAEPDTLRPWDLSVVAAELLRQSKLVNFKATENYFSVSDCLAGLDNIFRSLFGIKLESVPVRKGEVWHPSVSKLAFIHEEEGLIGYTYTDLFSRQDKLASDCHFTIRGGCELQTDSGHTTYQLPVITLCCSFGSSSSCLSQRSTENLFHEMGHALHSVLGRSKYQNVTGTRCSTDFAEVPSILMEFFLADSRVLSSFAKHYQTRECISPAQIKAFQISNNFFPAHETQSQILYAMMDQSLHSQPLEPNESVLDRYSQLHSQYSPLDYVPNTASPLRFNHFYSYAAKYYSYLWSRAVASLIWKACFACDPFSPSSGAKYREMLHHGGGVHPSTLVEGVLGFEPTISDLVNALYDNIVDRQRNMKDLLL